MNGVAMEHCAPADFSNKIFSYDNRGIRVTSIFKETVEDKSLTMCIHTDNEREYALSVHGGCRDYRREGFTSWFDAYDHGKRVLAWVCGVRQ